MMDESLIVSRKKLISIFLAAFLFLVAGCAPRTSIVEERVDVDFLAAQCWQEISALSGDAAAQREHLAQQVLDFQQAAEEVLAVREKSLVFAEQNKAFLVPDKPVPPNVLDGMKALLKQALEVTDLPVEIAWQNQCWLTADADEMSRRNLPEIGEDVRLKGTMLSLSASLLLYDSYLMTVASISEHEDARRFMNQSDLGYGIQEDQLAAITEAFMDRSYAMWVQAAIGYYEQGMPKMADRFQDDDGMQYLNQLIRQSPSYDALKNSDSHTWVQREAEDQRRAISDNFNKLNRRAVGGISEAFGDLVGKVEARKGKLYDDALVAAEVRELLQPGDILLEKTPFRLTDKLIPGHWGHAAIWLGTEEELQRLGIWNEPLVQKYHTQIREGRLVVEALRDGVQLNTLEHFMNIDDLGILRTPMPEDAKRAEQILRALRQVGKAYDFNFDVETTDTIVCSELVYQVYTDLEWPTDNIAGRYTISPDNVARKAIDDSSLELVLFYHDGKKVAQAESLTLMARLMAK